MKQVIDYVGTNGMGKALYSIDGSRGHTGKGSKVKYLTRESIAYIVSTLPSEDKVLYKEGKSVSVRVSRATDDSGVQWVVHLKKE